MVVYTTYPNRYVWLVTAVGGIYIYIPSRRKTTLAWCENESWRFKVGATEFNGFTATGSYRSMLLIVVAIKPENDRKQHAIIWRDAVSPSHFSALHIRLATTSAQLLL